MARSSQISFVLGAFAAAILLSGFAMCQSTDWHTEDSQTGLQALYQRSTYAHGYIHGYEDGFHNGDIDIHMGRGQRSVKEMKEYRAGDDAYRSQYGEKKYFHQGFQQGFREGYNDAIRGREFRAVYEAQKVAQGIAPVSQNANAKDPKEDHDFDRGFSAGYGMGKSAGTNGAVTTSGYEYGVSLCQSKMPRGDAAKQGYCDAFARGFGLGYADGVAQRPARTETAKK